MITGNILRTVSFTMLAAVLLTGCGGAGDGLIHISGAATFNGQPIPSGAVVLEPDSAQGNTGPQGYAYIKDGRFDTRLGSGKPVRAGALIVHIVGGDGKDADSMTPFGNKLFEIMTQNHEVKPESPTLTLEVPIQKKAGN